MAGVIKELEDFLRFFKLKPEYNEMSPIVQQNKTTFVCHVQVDSDRFAIGLGSSKKEAKRDAATKMLSQIGDLLDQVQQMMVNTEKPYSVNYVGILQEFCCCHKLPFPSYTYPAPVKQMFEVHVQVGWVTAVAQHTFKKAAKQKAAEKMLLELQTKPDENSNVNVKMSVMNNLALTTDNGGGHWLRLGQHLDQLSLQPDETCDFVRLLLQLSMQCNFVAEFHKVGHDGCLLQLNRLHPVIVFFVHHPEDPLREACRVALKYLKLSLPDPSVSPDHDQPTDSPLA